MTEVFIVMDHLAPKGEEMRGAFSSFDKAETFAQKYKKLVRLNPITVTRVTLDYEGDKWVHGELVLSL